MKPPYIDRIENAPGLYSFVCPCGYEKRRVNDSEPNFLCERPVEPKVKPCTLIHNLPSLVGELETRERKKEAAAFLATHDQKLEAAKEVLGIPEKPSPATDETKKLEKPKPKKKEK